jgi:3'(2'), 5'-bisphosphate nucleotidase
MSDTDAGRLAALLPPVLDAVAAAGTAILEVYATSHDVEYKADDSPLTRADRAAHEILAANGASTGSSILSTARRSSSAATASSP